MTTQPRRLTHLDSWLFSILAFCVSPTPLHINDERADPTDIVTNAGHTLNPQPTRCRGAKGDRAHIGPDPRIHGRADPALERSPFVGMTELVPGTATSGTVIPGGVVSGEQEGHVKSVQ